MKIELKKLKIAEHMSEETTAFTADIYVDGVNAGYAKNDGHGGCTGYHPNPGKRSLIESAEQFCLTLPPIKYPEIQGMKAFEVDMNLENLIDKMVEDELKRKDQKKLEKQLQKKMVNHIIWGVPNGTSYVQIKLPRPIASYSLPAIQTAIDKIKKTDLKEGEQILNTNLEVLGVKL